MSTCLGRSGPQGWGSGVWGEQAGSLDSTGAGAMSSTARAHLLSHPERHGGISPHTPQQPLLGCPSGPRVVWGCGHPVKSNRARANLERLALLSLGLDPSWSPSFSSGYWRDPGGDQGPRPQCTAPVCLGIRLSFRCSRKPALTSLLSASPAGPLGGAGGSSQRTGPATSRLGTVC